MAIFFCDAYIVAGEVDIEGDERSPRADDGRACFGKLAGTVIGLAFGLFDFSLQAFVLSAADVFEIGAFGLGRGGFVKIDGDIEFVSHALAESFGDGDAIIHRRALKRNEGNHIRRADAGMFAGMRVEVNQFGSGLDGEEGGFFHARRRPGEGQHGAVVVEVGGAVEEFYVTDRLDGDGDSVYHFGSARFGKVGDTFDELSCHGILRFWTCDTSAGSVQVLDFRLEIGCGVIINGAEGKGAGRTSYETLKIHFLMNVRCEGVAI